MPVYRITILDKNWKDVKERIQQNLEEQLKINEKIKRSRFIRPLQHLFRKTFGIDFTVEMSWKWVDERTLIHYVFGTAPIKESVYDNAEKGFFAHGKLRIEKLDKDGKVLEVWENG